MLKMRQLITIPKNIINNSGNMNQLLACQSTDFNIFPLF